MQIFNATGEGQTGTIQTYTAKETGKYILTAFGAEGSTGNSYNKLPPSTWKGGKGARVIAEVELLAGDILDIIVGQKGTSVQATSRDGTSGGGGGGTFVFKRISTISDTRYQFTKGSQPFEVLLVAAGGGGSNDYGYQTTVQDGFDGDGDSIYSLLNYISPNTASGSPTTSSSRGQGMGVQQYISYNGAGGYYTRSNGRALGGFGGGGCNDDAVCAGGGWYGSSTRAYSFTSGMVVQGITGDRFGDGQLIIEPKYKWETPRTWTAEDYINYWDFKRIWSNQQYLEFLGEEYLGNYVNITDFELKTMTDIPYMSRINTLERNLTNICSAFDIGYTSKTWIYPAIPDYEDWERWERTLFLVRQKAIATLGGFRRCGKPRCNGRRR